MRQLTRKAVFLLIIFVFAALFQKDAMAAVSDGMLVQAENDSNIYLIEAGEKRWIESPEAFRAQGFDWNGIATVNASELTGLATGENIGIYSKIVLPGEEAHLPDIIPFAMDNFLITQLDGRKILKFRSTFWNAGSGALEVGNGEPIDTASPDTNNVYQRILKDNGEYRDTLVNDFVWHSSHDHFHYDAFTHYILEPVIEGAAGTTAPAVKQKVSFCFWDTSSVDLRLASAPGNRVYANCDNTLKHGISVGWADVYPNSLPDQYFDIHDRPAGNYKLTLEVNTEDRIREQRYDNNKSITILYIDPASSTVQQIASGAPFKQAAFEFRDGMLIKGDASDEIYTTFNNKKRQLRGSSVLASYNHSADSAIVLPQGVINDMPYNNLVRADGVKVYALNDDGYKRHIRNPDVFNSYGLSWQDIADINQEEMSGYSDSSFVRVGGSAQLYYQYEHTVWPLASGAATGETFPWSQLQIINSTDFATYTVGPELSSIPSEPPPLPPKEAINDTDIPLTLPDGYRISYFTHMQVGPVRFMAVAPDGVLFATRPSNTGLYSGNSAGGAVLALPDRNGDGMADEAINAISELSDYPHGIAFYNDYLYLAEQSRVSRYPYIGDGAVGAREVVVEGLPSDGGHLSRTIDFSPSGKMYVSVGSKCNLCEEPDERRATIMEFNADGTGGRVYAEGLRNAVGIVFKPGTSELWATENGRDHLGDNLPGDEINIIQDGKHYGWPYCYGDKIADPEFNNPSFCSTTESSVHNIQAHSAALGLRFVEGEQFTPWQGDILVAYHGSWNRTEPTGYKVARLDVEGSSITNEEDFIYGWLQGDSKLGRPVDVIFGADGALYISDDGANTIYRVEKL